MMNCSLKKNCVFFVQKTPITTLSLSLPLSILYSLNVNLVEKNLTKNGKNSEMVDTNEVESHLIDRYEIRRRLGPNSRFFKFP